jgi:cyclopropane-fatty-acyl-phospholipid synthase
LFHLEDFGQDYARTLQLWRAAFHQHLPQVVALGYNAEFRRMWDFYLASCEAGFLETTTSVVHAHFTMPECQRERHTFQAA